jgi:glycosyltransferase involved in cell wall biosynthesis
MDSPRCVHMIDLNSVQVIIPAYNEEEALPGVITDLKAVGLSQIRVMDNGSSDRTAEVALLAGAEVLSEPQRGYGRACWAGYQHLPDSIQWVLFCDGDGSDCVEDLPLFFQKAQKADLILGNRRATAPGRAAMTPVQNFGNALATTLIRWGWGGDFQDLGPMRLIRREALERLAMKDRGFGWTVEMQVRALEEGLSCVEIPVNYQKRRAGQSKISGTIRGSFQAGIIILSTLFGLYLRGLGRHEPDSIKNSYPSAWHTIICVFFLMWGAWLMWPHGDFRVAGEVPSFLAGSAVMGVGFLLSWRLSGPGILGFWVVAFMLRGLLLPMVPGDDIWRYLWEGWIQNQGYNPYVLAPASEALASFRTPWWEMLNHREITAIYPPLAQLGFRLLTVFEPSVLVFKLAFVAADLVVCAVLVGRFGPSRAVLYAWNPLVLYSFAGAGHYDSWMILMVVLAWWFWDRFSRSSVRHDFFISVFLIGCGMALKYICAPLLIWMLWQIRRSQGGKTIFIASLLALSPFVVSLLMVPGSWDWSVLIPKDFALYARSAELIPHYLGLVWETSQRSNGLFVVPLLGVVLWRVLVVKQLKFFAEDYFLGLFVLSPVIHPWYFTWVMPFLVVTQNVGWRWLSLSAFVYFILQHRVATGDPMWKLTEPERLLLWLPLILGFIWWRVRGNVGFLMGNAK